MPRLPCISGRGVKNLFFIFFAWVLLVLNYGVVGFELEYCNTILAFLINVSASVIIL